MYTVRCNILNGLQQLRHCTLMVISVVSLLSCQTTKYVPDGQRLLDRVSLSVEGHSQDINLSELKAYVHQQPNARWFALYKLPLVTYSVSGRDTSKWINRTLRNIGEPPVIYDHQIAMRSLADIRQSLRNSGFLDAEVQLIEKPKGKKKQKIEYVLYPCDQYFIRHVYYEVADSAIANFLNMHHDSLNRLVKEGLRFEMSLIDAERNRITQLLNDNGYYRFHKEFIKCQADSAQGSRLIDLTFYISKDVRKGQSMQPHKTFYIHSVDHHGAGVDSLIHLRPSVLRECTHLVPGEKFSSANLRSTYNHFGRLQAVKYTSINFTQHPDTSLIDCDIQIQTNKPSTISFLPEGTNTAGDLGAAVTLSYLNRNLFRGSEQFSVELRGAYEAISGLEGYVNQDFKEYSAQVSLGFPRFVAPFVGYGLRRDYNATSEVRLLFDMQDRPEFHRRVLSLAWRYKWNNPQRHDSYQLDVLDLNYVFMPWISETFRHDFLDVENSRNAVLRYNYEDLFITKLGLSYSYNHKNWAVKWGAETSGNILSLLSRQFDIKKDERGYYRLFNIAFAQYAKGDLDVTRSFEIDRESQLVLHLGMGIAYPYGNSNVLPFEKRYFSGGANSVRGWSVRTLGPGRYREKDGRINFINQTGDMKLDLNAEYRTHLYWKLYTALFIDAGNIWTLREYEWQEGGQFKPQTFLEDLAFGYGLGFRFNFDYFILRFDLGMKAVNPAFRQDESSHYPILSPRLSRDFTFHFAVGMPF